MLVGQPPGSALDELAYLIRTLQAEVGSRLAVAVLVVSDDDPDAVELDRIEGVFVGEVVADVDRQQGTGRVDTVADPGQRGALVPVEVGPQFDDHAPAGHPEARPRSELMCGRDDLTNPVRRHLAVVHRDGKTLVLDANSRNRGQARLSSAAARSRTGTNAAAASFSDGCRPARSTRSRGCLRTRRRVCRPGLRTSARSRPLRMATGHTSATSSSASAAPSTSLAAAGSETMGDSVPS